MSSTMASEGTSSCKGSKGMDNRKGRTDNGKGRTETDRNGARRAFDKADGELARRRAENAVTGVVWLYTDYFAIHCCCTILKN